MNYQIIRNIIKGYENQLDNAIISGQQSKINWLKAQIEEGHKVLATQSVGYSK